MRAAEAVAAALQGEAPEADVQVVDILEVAPAPVRALCRDLYVGMVQHSPRMVGWLYRRTDRPGGGGLRRGLVHAAMGSVRRLVAAQRPAVVVSSHFLATEVVAPLRRSALCGSLASVVTDSDAHGLWIWPEVDRYFVAGAMAAERLALAGVPGARVEESGIPIHPAFERLPPRPWARQVLGVPDDRPLILFSTGGCCVGPVEAILRQLLLLPVAAQLVVLCGKAKEARERLTAVAAAAPRSRSIAVRVEGFTDRMHLWMCAADLMVGKPGGLTSAECRAAGLPLIITNEIPGQEERNALQLLKEGAARRCPDPAALTEMIRGLFERPTELAALAGAARRSAAPLAARRIARWAAAQLHLAAVQKSKRTPA